MMLQSIATIKTNFQDADFWLIRKGSEKQVGKPVETFNPEHIGIKVESSLVLPKFLFYALTYLHNKGYFANQCNGTLSLKHITLDTVKKIRIG